MVSKRTKTLTTAVLSAAMASLCAAGFVELDISSYYNYDGVATSNEMTANVPGNGNFLRDSVGDHSITNGRAYANQGSVGSGTALPDSGTLTGAG